MEPFGNDPVGQHHVLDQQAMRRTVIPAHAGRGELLPGVERRTETSAAIWALDSIG
jgi:hypothetical protein